MPSHQKSDVFMNCVSTHEACSLEEFAGCFVILSIISTSIESYIVLKTLESKLEVLCSHHASEADQTDKQTESLEYRWLATSLYPLGRKN